MGPVTVEGGRVVRLSGEGTVLPRLIATLGHLREDLHDRLDEALLPDPCYELPARLERIFHSVVSIGRQLPVTLNGPRSPEVLDEVKLLMHEVSSTGEYLGKVVGALTVQHDNAAKKRPMKNKFAHSVVERLERYTERMFKIPINQVKHDSFKLAWLEVTYNGDSVPVRGFTVEGLVKKRTIGPLVHKHPTVAEEGYSFPLFLRKAVENIYMACNVVDEALLNHLGPEAFVAGQTHLIVIYLPAYTLRMHRP